MLLLTVQARLKKKGFVSHRCGVNRNIGLQVEQSKSGASREEVVHVSPEAPSYVISK